jgi:hypothetical protein
MIETNTCDKCKIVEPVTELVWDSDDEWWDSKWAKQNKYVALCDGCFYDKEVRIKEFHNG